MIGFAGYQLYLKKTAFVSKTIPYGPENPFPPYLKKDFVQNRKSKFYSTKNEKSQMALQWSDLPLEIQILLNGFVEQQEQYKMIFNTNVNGYLVKAKALTPTRAELAQRFQVHSQETGEWKEVTKYISDSVDLYEYSKIGLDVLIQSTRYESGVELIELRAFIRDY